MDPSSKTRAGSPQSFIKVVYGSSAPTNRKDKFFCDILSKMHVNEDMEGIKIEAINSTNSEIISEIRESLQDAT